MRDLTQLKAIPIKDVYTALGYDLPRGRANARCFSDAHKNGDKHPSLGLNDRTNHYKCFSCGISGDTIGLVQDALGVDFNEAVEWLANHFNVMVDNTRRKDDRIPDFERKSPYERPKTVQTPRLTDSYEYQPPNYLNVYKYFYELTADPNEQLLTWWHKRGLDDELLKASGWRSITKDTWTGLTTKYDAKTLLEAGLLTEYNGKLKPLFYDHTVAVPFYNEANTNDELIYLRARTLNPNAKAKYLAPRNTSPPIYNYHRLIAWALDDPKTKPLYITESETDALAIQQLNGGYAIALVGGQKTSDSLVVRELVAILKDITLDATINIVTDRDKTGDVFYNAVARALYLEGFSGKKLTKWQEWQTEYKDIGEAIATQ